ncbi:MAG TPA: alpha/beta fold hydrolase [Steroidobacteraceae bacterium]|nr:alpha/beta fold hydrolase [Steroidobacteraceae bacterium]
MPFNQLELAPQGRAPVIVRIFESTQPAKAVVIIGPAMGVSQSFYGLFAEWLAVQGYVAITFDYRGMGLAAPPTLRGFKADIFDWARDCDAVIELASSRLPRLPLYWIGHSLGGQLLGLMSNRNRLTRVVTVAAGSGYWHENSWPTKRVVWALWFGIAPIITPLAGYFPGKRLRIVGNLPRGVIEQWRRWCLNPEYVVGVEGEQVRAAYNDVRLPILSISLTDDEMMSDRSIHSLHGLYGNAHIEYRRIAPRDLGAKRIGHFGFFRQQFEAKLWTAVSTWLAKDQDQTNSTSLE